MREMAKKIEDVEAAATVTRVKIMDLHIAPRSSQTEHAKFSERCEDRAQESAHEFKISWPDLRHGSTCPAVMKSWAMSTTARKGLEPTEDEEPERIGVFEARKDLIKASQDL